MIRPIRDRVLVRRVKRARTTKSGLVIPGIAERLPQEGIVVAVGPGGWTPKGKRIAPSTEPGDRVIFGRHSGDEIEHEGQTYLMMREDDIITKIVI